MNVVCESAGIRSYNRYGRAKAKVHQGQGKSRCAQYTSERLFSSNTCVLFCPSHFLLWYSCIYSVYKSTPIFYPKYYALKGRLIHRKIRYIYISFAKIAICAKFGKISSPKVYIYTVHTYMNTHTHTFVHISHVAYFLLYMIVLLNILMANLPLIVMG